MLGQSATIELKKKKMRKEVKRNQQFSYYLAVTKEGIYQYLFCHINVIQYSHTNLFESDMIVRSEERWSDEGMFTV